MKILHIFVGITLVLASFFGCSNTSSFIPGMGKSKNSDAFISYTVQGNKIHMEDWICGEAMPSSILGAYNNADSSFWLRGRNGCSNDGNNITFTFRSRYDTSTHLLKLLSTVDNFGEITVNMGNGMLGNVTMNLPDATYSTDSIRNGIITITSIDSTRKTGWSPVISGIFSFSALKIFGKASSPDTIRVDSGIISQMQINVF